VYALAHEIALSPSLRPEATPQGSRRVGDDVLGIDREPQAPVAIDRGVQLAGRALHPANDPLGVPISEASDAAREPLGESQLEFSERALLEYVSFERCGPAGEVALADRDSSSTGEHWCGRPERAGTQKTQLAEHLGPPRIARSNTNRIPTAHKAKVISPTPSCIQSGTMNRIV